MNNLYINFIILIILISQSFHVSCFISRYLAQSSWLSSNTFNPRILSRISLHHGHKTFDRSLRIKRIPSLYIKASDSLVSRPNKSTSLSLSQVTPEYEGDTMDSNLGDNFQPIFIFQNAEQSPRQSTVHMIQEWAVENVNELGGAMRATVRSTYDNSQTRPYP